MYSPSPKAKRIEVRFPDPSCNPYLAFSAMLMAGLDGIENKINPGEPAEKDLYDLEPKEAAKIRTMPGSLDEALNHLEKDHQFLLKGGVFTEDLIEAWISYKRTREVDPMRLRPNPYEFFLYYDV
jgi:glutamine synthetase